MKTTNSIISSAGRAGAALVLLATLSFTGAAFGKKGGGGKPGGEDPPPEPDPAPVSYLLSWIESPGDATRLADIDSNGVAVGQVLPGGLGNNRYGIVSFPDREVINLHDLAAAHIPGGWELTVAFTISDNLVISGDLRDPADGLHCFALQLVDNGPSVDPSILWLHTFSSSSVGSSTEFAEVRDASNNGDLAIVTIGWADGLDRTFVWTPAAGGPSLGSTLVGGFVGIAKAINSNRELLFGNSIVNVDTGATQAIPAEAGRGKEGMSSDFNDNGIVSGRVKETKGNPSVTAARVLNGSWESFGPSVKAIDGGAYANHVNNAGDAIGKVGADLFLFSDQTGVGFRLIDELLDSSQDLNTWNSAGLVSAYWLGLSEPGNSGYGYVCGARPIDGLERAFILTPVAAP